VLNLYLASYTPSEFQLFTVKGNITEKSNLISQKMVKVLLIIDSLKNYVSLFKDIKVITFLNERGEEEEDQLEVDQCGWEDMKITSYSDSGALTSYLIF
jgi:uncharacterized protein YfaQ (DUF2300 family)